ncbi:MAG TPA: Rne/Rng family ribonuclease [Beijerinckiaceae bacterium]|jgi:ribonuclease E
MANKMLIDASHPEETRVTVVRGQKVEEFDFESASRRQLRGNIYLAKVTRVEPSLQAAFVEYGGNRHGFLAFSEIHPDYYQIPVADRQALLAEDARAEREEEREDERRRSRPRRGRNAPRRAAETGETVTQEVADEHAAEDHGSHDGEAPGAAPIGADEAPPGLAPAESFDESGAPVTELVPGERGEAQDGQDENEKPRSASTDPDALISEAAEAEAAEAETETGIRSEASAGEAEVEDRGDNEAQHGDEEAEPVIEQVGGRGDAMEELPERRRPYRRQYKIQEVIKRRQILLVQVVKEERGNKGAALTTYLSLAGRYSVLMPNTGRGGGISRKITSAADRKRLKEIATDLEVPEGMGVILRTAGASRTRAEIKRDFEYLMRLWESVRELTLTSSAPALVYEEGSLIKRAIRDLYNKDIDEVLVAGDEAYREAKDFMRMLMPSHAKAVKPYKDPQPLFARFGVEQQLDAMFSNHVTLRSGGYLVINPTEALVSIDVNSGRSTREHNIEDTALRTNMEAAEEVARQLRLRDLAGLIVIDFIDMEEKRNNRTVEKKLNECLKNDRARIQVGRISPFGLLEMSRQRIRTGVLESSSIPCPHCGGAGHVRSTPSVALHVLRSVEEHLIKSASHNLCVRTRAQVAFYILNQKRTHLRELEERFGVVISVVADEGLTGQSVFAIERTEPVAPRAEPRPPAPTVRIDAVAPVDEDEEAEEARDADEAEDREDAAEPTRAGEGERADRPERPGEDGEGGRRRRRRRRRRGRNGEPREDRLDAAGSPEGSGAEDEGDEDEGPEEAAAAEPAGETDEPRRREGGDERRPGRRDRHRRGRDRWRDREGERREHRPEAHEARELVEAHGAAGESREEAPAPAPSWAEARQDRESRQEPVSRQEPEQEPRSRQASESRPQEPTPEAASPNGAAEAPQAPEQPARPPEPEPEPVAVVLTPPDPNRPKRAGWWSKAKAALGGS